MSLRIIELKILTAHAPQELSDAVNRHLSSTTDLWALHGELKAIAEPDGHIIYVQSVARLDTLKLPGQASIHVPTAGSGLFKP